MIFNFPLKRCKERYRKIGKRLGFGFVNDWKSSGEQHVGIYGAGWSKSTIPFPVFEHTIVLGNRNFLISVHYGIRAEFCSEFALKFQIDICSKEIWQPNEASSRAARSISAHPQVIYWNSGGCDRSRAFIMHLIPHLIISCPHPKARPPPALIPPLHGAPTSAMFTLLDAKRFVPWSVKCYIC